MGISGIQNNWWLYSAQASLQGISSSTAVTSATASNLMNLVNAADSDGDTLEVSDSTQGVASKYPMYGPPKGASRPEGPGPNPEIKDFLDKVANGTATDADLQSMQGILQQSQMQVSGNTAATDLSAGSDDDSIKTFLDKVANGTATDSDLQSMQSVLQEMQQRFNQGMVGKDDTNNSSDDIQSFLDKVAAGTVTADDLQDMQSILEQRPKDSGGVSMHRHHRPGSESDGTNPTSTSLDTADANGSDLKSFLDKVAVGTATDDDLENMQSVLQSMQVNFESGLTYQNDSDSNPGSFMAQYAFSKF